MITEFCIFCGELESLENHHILPRVLDGTDQQENLITLCTICHDKIHLIGKPSNHLELQRIGIEKAKAAGLYKGRQQVITLDQIVDMNLLVAEGMPKTQVAKFMNISRDTLYRYMLFT